MISFKHKANGLTIAFREEWQYPFCYMLCLLIYW